jgi:hypothetical protein
LYTRQFSASLQKEEKFNIFNSFFTIAFRTHAMTIATTRRFTLEEYDRLADLGFFADRDRVELIRGEGDAIELPRLPDRTLELVKVFPGV